MNEVKLEGKSFRESQVTSADIAIHNISVNDLWHALQAGYRDFNATPSFGVFLILIYPLCALLFSLFLTTEGLPYLAFPLLAGFTLIGPIVCLVLIEMSRRREAGEDPNWRATFDFVHSSSFAPIVALSLVMMLLYVAWLFMAQFIYFGLFSVDSPTSVAGFVTELFSSRRGAALIMYGTGVGFIFAFTALAVSVVAFPLLLEKPATAATAIAVSFRAVIANPLTMAVWGLIVATLLIAGAAVLLVGLAVALPILGHATWHLYRKVVRE